MPEKGSDAIFLYEIFGFFVGAFIGLENEKTV